MSLAPSPSSTRGDVVLQPAYFTSSPFVRPARADIDRLVREYAQRYACSGQRPFALFKQVWQTQGWTWIHFKVFDARSRAAFLGVVMRLFLERIEDGDPPLHRVAALFGLYALYRTQPSTLASTLYCATQVEVTCDVYRAMLMLPDALDGEMLGSVRPYALYVLSELLGAGVLRILPDGEMNPLNPRVLPREVVVEDGEAMRKRRGRPSKQARTRKARDCVAALARACEGGESAGDASGTRGRYVQAKAALEEWGAGLREAEMSVMERMGELYNYL